MAKRGRKEHLDPPVEWIVNIPTSLSAKVELLLYDPMLQKPKYGAKSGLVQQLLREWLERQQADALSDPPALTGGLK